MFSSCRGGPCEGSCWVTCSALPKLRAIANTPIGRPLRNSSEKASCYTVLGWAAKPPRGASENPGFFRPPGVVVGLFLHPFKECSKGGKCRIGQSLCGGVLAHTENARILVWCGRTLEKSRKEKTKFWSRDVGLAGRLSAAWPLTASFRAKRGRPAAPVPKVPLYPDLPFAPRQIKSAGGRRIRRFSGASQTEIRNR